MTSSSQAALVKDFQKWLTETMHIPENNKFNIHLRPDDCKVFMSDKYKHIWQYIVRNIRPANEVKKIKGNLLISSSNKNKDTKTLDKNVCQSKKSTSGDDNYDDDDEKMRHMTKELDKIERENSEIDDSIVILCKDIDRIKKEIIDQQLICNKRKTEVINQSIMNKLNDEMKKSLEERKDGLNELMMMVDERIKKLDDVRRKSEANENSPKARRIYNDDNDDDNKVKHLTTCCAMVEDYYHKSFLKAVNHNWLSQQLKIEDEVKLLVEKSTPYQTVSLLADSMDQSHRRLGQILANQKESFELEKRSAILKGAILKLEGHVKRLTKEIQEGQNKQEMMDKEKLFLNMKANSSLYNQSILSHQNKIVSYVRRELVGQFKYPTCQSQRLLYNEAELFNWIGLNKYKLINNVAMLFFILSAGNQSNASIHELLINEAWPYTKATNDVLDILELPSYKSSDGLLLFIAATILGVGLDSCQHARLRQSGSIGFGSSIHSQQICSLVDELKNLGVKLSIAEKQHIETYQPMIVSRINQSQQALAACARINRNLSDWWIQPAQHLVPWILVDELNVKGWLDRWNAIINKLKQKKNIKPIK
ncbi:hypothetical protein HELRODRAFT_177270 [Helobdella robusta]|uniref:Uncharacterized protein n=1 Tax=Helobdella robusta TaxID=6412 RepID=T1FBF7_HELRO|nr:hypothetical protein HELRODRAFT_177270 [Helobdella robusta]ESN98041.1 hypothetical protein HELRODRAFT_177270 [Helobdella robusta]